MNDLRFFTQCRPLTVSCSAACVYLKNVMNERYLFLKYRPLIVCSIAATYIILQRRHETIAPTRETNSAIGIA